MDKKENIHENRSVRCNDSELIAKAKLLIESLNESLVNLDVAGFNICSQVIDGGYSITVQVSKTTYRTEKL